MTTRAPLRIMPLGGSITYGVGSSDGNGYRKALYEALTSAGFTVTMLGSRKAGTMDNSGNNSSQEGWRGFKINEIREKGVKSAKACQPNIFAINGGSNDCIQNFEVGTAGKRMEEMLRGLWEVCPGSTIVLSTLLRNRNPNFHARVVDINEQIRDLVRLKEAEGKRIVLADMDTAQGPQVGDLPDGTHPNDEGYKKMADVWFDSIQAAVSKGFLQ